MRILTERNMRAENLALQCKCLPGKHKILSSILGNQKKKRKEKIKKELVTFATHYYNCSEIVQSNKVRTNSYID